MHPGDQSTYDSSMLAQAGQDMGWLSRTLFESPGIAILVLALLWASMRVIGRRTDNKRVLLVSWLPLLFVGGLLASSTLVTTPTERLAQTVKELLLAVEDEEMQELGELILPEAMTAFLKREMPRDAVFERIEKAQINDLNLTGLVVMLENETTGSTLMRVRADGVVADVPGIEISEWAIRWTYVDGRWRAIRLECTAIGADAIFNSQVN